LRIPAQSALGQNHSTFKPRSNDKKNGLITEKDSLSRFLAQNVAAMRQARGFTQALVPAGQSGCAAFAV